MNKKEENKRNLIVLLITFSLLIAFLLMVLITIFATPNKIQNKNKIIVEQMLNALNKDIAQENNKATRLISFSYDDNGFYITGKSEAKMFFYYYQEQVNNPDTVLNSFCNKKEEYLSATELTYIDVYNEKYMDNTLDQYIVETSKSLDDKYHVAMLVKNDKSYSSISHAVINQLTDHIDTNTNIYSQKDNKNVFNLCNYIYESYQK